ncbi:MAG: ribose 5-phosphate isomerase B [Rickettsiales bacterium]|nr:ribose 5-phosphate isomerase B [Rickettsiales bacterium]
MQKHPLAIASDHAGFELKKLLTDELQRQSLSVDDLGTHSLDSVDYPDYGHAMAKWIAANPQGKGILICGSGVGVSIAANRHKEVRAALCQDGLTAQLSRKHNDANVLCLGSRLIGIETAKDCITQFLNTEFEGGRHAARIAKL